MTGVCAMLTRRTVIGFIFVFSFVLLPVLAASQSSDLVDLVTAGTAQTAASIVSGRGKVTVQAWALRKGGGVAESETSHDLVFCGSEFRVLSEQRIVKYEKLEGENGPEAGAIIRTAASYDGKEVTVYFPHRNTANVFAPPTSNRQSGKWSHFSPQACGLYALSFPTGTASATREMIDGTDLLVVEAVTPLAESPKHQVKRAVYHLDPSRGFTLCQRRIYLRDDEHPDYLLLEEMNSEARDYGDGLWGPSKCTNISYRPDGTGNMRMSSKVTVTYDSDFRLNVALNEDELKIVLPSETNVYDAMIDGSYIVP